MGDVIKFKSKADLEEELFAENRLKDLITDILLVEHNVRTIEWMLQMLKSEFTMLELFTEAHPQQQLFTINEMIDCDTRGYY